MKRFLGFTLLLTGSWFFFDKLACAPEPISLATFNIRMFPEQSTDPGRVAELLAEVDADVIAVQEIRDEDALLSVLKQASRLSGRDFKLALSSCGGPGNLSTGIVYDASRLTLIGARQFKEHRADDEGSCARGHRPALLAVVEDAHGQRVAALSVHLQHGPNPDQLAARKKQWAGVVQILKDVEKQYKAHAVALGDFNSTGYTDNAGGEREFIEKTLEDAGLRLATSQIACTAYWQPEGERGDLTPSILDHIVVSGGEWATPEPRGMCQALSCQKTSADKLPRDYKTVSDHCPLRIVGQ